MWFINKCRKYLTWRISKRSRYLWKLVMLNNWDTVWMKWIWIVQIQLSIYSKQDIDAKIPLHCDDSWIISIVRLNTVVIIRSAEDELLLEVREAPALLSHLSKDPSLSWTYLKPCCGPGTCFGPCSKTTMNCIKSVAWLFILLFGSRWATQLLMQRKAKTTYCLFSSVIAVINIFRCWLTDLLAD